MSTSVTPLGIAATLLAVVLEIACGGSSAPPVANISLSPSKVGAGGTDLTLTINGSTQFAFTKQSHHVNVVVWRENDVETSFWAGFISTSQITAVIPAALLSQPVQAQVRVEIWDIQGDAPEVTSSTVPFTVTSGPD